MLTSVDKQKLLSAISLAIRVVGKKESLPVLSCIIFESRKSEVVLRATNLESGVEIRIPSKVEKTGVCAIPAHIFMQTIRTMRTPQITIALKDKNIVCTSGASTTTIHTVPHEEFPSIPIPVEGAVFTLPRSVFLNGVKSVAYAASTSTIRQEFASIFITYKDGAVVFASTDSFRLAEKKLHTQVKKHPEDVLIPVKNALDLAYILESESDDDVVCTIVDSQLHASFENVSFVSRVVDAAFPAYESIIPKKTTTEATVLKEDISSVLQKATIFSGDARQIGLHLYPKKKIFTASAQHASVGEMSDAVDAAISGDDIDINFNIAFIADCLQSISADSVVLKFSGPGKPLIIEGVGDKTFRYLVMPLNR